MILRESVGLTKPGFLNICGNLFFEAALVWNASYISQKGDGRSPWKCPHIHTHTHLKLTPNVHVRYLDLTEPSNLLNLIFLCGPTIRKCGNFMVVLPHSGIFQRIPTTFRSCRDLHWRPPYLRVSVIYHSNVVGTVRKSFGFKSSAWQYIWIPV